jgi:hypothetical protein
MVSHEQGSVSKNLNSFRKNVCLIGQNVFRVWRRFSRRRFTFAAASGAAEHLSSLLAGLEVMLQLTDRQQRRHLHFRFRPFEGLPFAQV